MFFSFLLHKLYFITLDKTPLHLNLSNKYQPMLWLFAQRTVLCCFVLTLIQPNLISSCFDCLCTLRWLFDDDLYSHWSQLYSTPSCFDCLWTFRWHFCVALYSHWLQPYSREPPPTYMVFLRTCFFFLRRIPSWGFVKASSLEVLRTLTRIKEHILYAKEKTGLKKVRFQKKTWKR